MTGKTFWGLLLAPLAALLLAGPAGAETELPAEEPVRAVVLYEVSADPAETSAALAVLEGVTVLCRYDSLFAGAAVEAAPSRLAAAESLPGVAGVGLARSYTCVGAAETGDAPGQDGGLALMGADALWEQGYTGDGMVIAVLDSGLAVDHEAFADDSLMAAPALSREDVEDFAAKGGTAGRYVSRRIPFAYDYYGRSDDVSTGNGHGAHVTALAAGFARDGDGTVRFRGAAPAAQILSMKIFPKNSGGGTDDTIILRALEDAWNLGADVVNLSVGTGAGFSQDELLDGIYCRAYAQMAQAGVIICCAAGNEGTAAAAKAWQPSLPGGAYTDYGSICSPASYRGAVAVAAAAQEGRRGVRMADYSSWGPSSGLHLAPALTGFGGPAVSADVSDGSGYREDSGTSMASGSVSGLFAVTLQALRERGVADKVQAARLAQSLLESAAGVLCDSRGVPVSPRRQGAGLADLEAALASDLVILDPLVELGESGDGRFSMALTLRNLSAKAITAALDAVVLTDDFEIREDGAYSLLSARDITGGVAVSGPGTVTVPAGGEKTVTLTLTVGAGLKKELDAAFPNGFYVEGYVSASAGGSFVHAAFLGYCGDWEKAPVLETVDFRDVQDAGLTVSPGWRAELGELGAELGANLAFLAEDADLDDPDRLLGANPYRRAPYNSERNAMPGGETDAMATSGGQLCLELYALRNAAGVVLLVSDPDTGEVWHAQEEAWMEKSTANTFGGTAGPACRLSWDGTDGDGVPLPGGTVAQVDVYAWLDTDTAVREARKSHPGSFSWLLEDACAPYRAMRFPVAIDNAAPTVSAALDGGTGLLTLTVRDDRHAARAAVTGAGRELLAEEAFVPAGAGEDCVLTVDLSGYDVLPDAVYIQTEDYAGNAAGYSLDLRALAAGEGAGPVRCFLSLLGDASLSAWYHEAVDFVLDRGLMTVRGDMEFLPDRAATRAEIVTALYRASGSPDPGIPVNRLPFSDVSVRASYADAVCWAYEQGVVAGREDGTFGGSAKVTRQELAVMLYRCAKLTGGVSAAGSLSRFPDGDGAADWAKEALAWAVGEGILAGNGEGLLSPEGNVTRAETAAMVMRFAGRQDSDTLQPD